jgi:hypothetical protein
MTRTADDVIVAVVDVAAADTVEPKVKAATAASAAVAAVLPFVLWLLATYVFDGEVPLPVQGFVGFVVSGACTFVAGYRARHVDRALEVIAR